MTLYFCGRQVGKMNLQKLFCIPFLAAVLGNVAVSSSSGFA